MLALAAPAAATSRIKDLANFEGVRQNQLIGYGLVVGLNGTGDTLNNIPFTKQSIQAMLERMGVNIRGVQIRTGNVAAVMVTANLPPFGTQGTRIDVTVSSLGDAKSLMGGTLLVTPLLGADGNVYAVGQGSVAIAGFVASGEAANSRSIGSTRFGWRCAMPTSPRPSASPPRSTTSSADRWPSRSIPRPYRSRCPRNIPPTSSRC
jgi:flagellar P-ring protein FlgI